MKKEVRWNTKKWEDRR